jgi:hypothetical protein
MLLGHELSMLTMLKQRALSIQRHERLSRIFNLALAVFYWVMTTYYLILIGLGVYNGWYWIVTLTWGGLGGMFFWLYRRQKRNAAQNAIELKNFDDRIEALKKEYDDLP